MNNRWRPLVTYINGCQNEMWVLPLWGFQFGGGDLSNHSDKHVIKTEVSATKGKKASCVACSQETDPRWGGGRGVLANVVGEAGNMVCRFAGLSANSTPLPSCVILDKSPHVSEPNFTCNNFS